MNVAQATELRKFFKQNSVEYKVTKNTLTKIAAINAGYDEENINKLLDGQIAIAYSDSDPTAPAKVIKEFKKEHKNCLDVVGLIFEGEFFEPEKYKQFILMILVIIMVQEKISCVIFPTILKKF